LYFVRTYTEAEDAGQAALASLAVLFYLRAVVGGLGHAVYTGTTGAALGFARETTSRFLKVVVPPIGLVLAMCQHATWNLFATAMPSLLKTLHVSGALYLFVFAPFVSL